MLQFPAEMQYKVSQQGFETKSPNKVLKIESSKMKKDTSFPFFPYHHI